MSHGSTGRGGRDGPDAGGTSGWMRLSGSRTCSPGPSRSAPRFEGSRTTDRVSVGTAARSDASGGVTLLCAAPLKPVHRHRLRWYSLVTRESEGNPRRSLSRQDAAKGVGSRAENHDQSISDGPHYSFQDAFPCARELLLPAYLSTLAARKKLDAKLHQKFQWWFRLVQERSARVEGRHGPLLVLRTISALRS